MATYDFSAAFAKSFSAIGNDDTQTLLDLLKLYLGIDPNDPTNDEELERALNFAGDMIETYLDRVIVKRPIDEHFPHHFGTVILHNLPADINAPLNVYLNGTLQTDYKTYLGRGKLAHVSRINTPLDQPMDWRNFDQVTVTYTAGYDPIPSDLAYSIVVLAAMIYNAEGTGSPPSSSVGTMRQFQLYDVGSVSYDTGGASEGGGMTFSYQAGLIPSNIAAMLTPYRRLSA